MYDHLLYSPYQQTYFCVDMIRRVYILINWLGLEGLSSRVSTLTSAACIEETLLHIIYSSAVAIEWVKSLLLGKFDMTRNIHNIYQREENYQ